MNAWSKSGAKAGVGIRVQQICAARVRCFSTHTFNKTTASFNKQDRKGCYQFVHCLGWVTGEVSIAVPIGGIAGAVVGALLGLIKSPRFLVLLTVFAGSSAGAVAGKLPWGEVGEIGGQIVGGLVGGAPGQCGYFWATGRKSNSEQAVTDYSDCKHSSSRSTLSRDMKLGEWREPIKEDGREFDPGHWAPWITRRNHPLRFGFAILSQASFAACLAFSHSRRDLAFT